MLHYIAHLSCEIFYSNLFLYFRPIVFWPFCWFFITILLAVVRSHVNKIRYLLWFEEHIMLLNVLMFPYFLDDFIQSFFRLPETATRCLSFQAGYCHCDPDGTERRSHYGTLSGSQSRYYTGCYFSWFTLWMLYWLAEFFPIVI